MTTPEDTTNAPAIDATQAKDAPFMRTIKTYVLRAGRMGSGQVRAFEQFGPHFLIPYSAERLDVPAAFGRSAPLILEIGFGMGDATAKIAQVRPNDNFLCCEVHEPGVGALLKRCGEEHIGNIRIVQHDAIEVMDNMLGIHQDRVLPEYDSAKFRSTAKPDASFAVKDVAAANAAILTPGEPRSFFVGARLMF